MRQALPTNSWFSSLAYMQWSGVLHAHPLSFKATESGFEMGLPEKAVEPIEAIKAWAWPPPPGRPIASVVHRHVAALKVSPKNFQPADARLSAKGDWSISIDMAEEAGDRSLVAHIGHGIPYGFFEISDGAVVIDLEDGGSWADEGPSVIDNKQVMYAGVRGVAYAVYLPAGAKVGVVDGRRLEVVLGPGASYFSVAAVLNERTRPGQGPGERAPNQPPVFASETVEVDVDLGQAGSLVHTARAVDPDGASVTYTLDGPDASSFVVAADGGVRFRQAPDYADPGSRSDANSYVFLVVADDGTGGVARQSVTVSLRGNAGTGQTPAYDTVILDWENGPADVNPGWVFGGAVSSAAVHDDANVLKFSHPIGSEAWAGVALIEAAGGTDLIADRGDSVSMRVWAEADGSVTLAMEDISSISPNAGATRYLSVTEDVVGGQWNELRFDFGDPDSASGDTGTDHNKLVLKVNEGNTLYVDQVTLAGADVVTRPAKCSQRRPRRPLTISLCCSRGTRSRS